MLEPYVENSIICFGISHPGGQPSVMSMYIPDRIEKISKIEGKSW